MKATSQTFLNNATDLHLFPCAQFELCLPKTTVRNQTTCEQKFKKMHNLQNCTMFQLIIYTCTNDYFYL